MSTKNEYLDTTTCLECGRVERIIDMQRCMLCLRYRCMSCMFDREGLTHYDYRMAGVKRTCQNHLDEVWG